MAETTKISWAHSTGGPWLVCSKVSPGCERCYAWDFMEKRLGGLVRQAYKKAGFTDWATRPTWGESAPRVLTKGFWKDALTLNRKAGEQGIKYRMFPSLIDWLDKMPAGIIDPTGLKLDPHAVRAQFLDVIHNTPNLIWMLLTKRPENWRELVTAAYNVSKQDWIASWLHPQSPVAPSNVWFGITCEDQPRANARVPKAIEVPAVLRFISGEPLLSEVNLWEAVQNVRNPMVAMASFQLLIAGGESGKGFRPLNYNHARGLFNQSRITGASFHMKQDSGFKSGNRGKIPDDLWIQEIPT